MNNKLNKINVTDTNTNNNTRNNMFYNSRTTFKL